MSDHASVAEHRDWQLGEWVEIELPDGRRIRCRVVAVLDDGTVQVVPDVGTIDLSGGPNGAPDPGPVLVD